MYEVNESFNPIFTIFDKVKTHVKNKIVNDYMALPLSDVSSFEAAQEILLECLKEKEEQLKKIPPKQPWLTKQDLLLLPVGLFLAVLYSSFSETKQSSLLSSSLIFTFLLWIIKLKIKAELKKYANRNNFFTLYETTDTTAYSIDTARKQAGDILVKKFPYFLKETNIAGKIYKIGDPDAFTFLCGIEGLKLNSLDCAAISGLVLLELLISNANFQRIERFGSGTDSYNPLAHSFVVVDRYPGTDEKDISTWNDSATIIDPWYDVLITASEINCESDFFLRYPLLSTHDKKVLSSHDNMIESSEKYSPLIQYYERTLEQLDVETPNFTL